MQILLGKNKSGKTKYIFEKIDEDILNKRKCLLIVPSQMRMETETKYLNEQEKQGIMEFDITSFERIVSSYINSLSLDNSKMITALDKAIIIRRAINNNQGVFKIYAKAKNTEGFFASIDILIDLFRKENISVEELEKIELEDKYLECKIKEIAKIYKIYLEEVEKKYIDFAKEYDIFNSYLTTSEYLDNTNIYIDGFNNFSKWEYDIISRLLNKNLNITISLVTDVKSVKEAEDKLENSMYSVANNTYLKLNKLCVSLDKSINTVTFNKINNLQNKEIEFLVDNIYETKKERYQDEIKNVAIMLTTNPYTELEMLAKNIKEHIINGYRYSDFCIYTNEIEKYDFPIRKMFYEYEIPFYIDTPVSIKSNSLVIYILSLIDVCNKNYQIEDVFTFLKTYLTDIKEEDIYYLENYVLEYNIVGVKWHNVFEKKGNSSNNYAYDFERLNKIRSQVINIFNEFKVSVEQQKTAIDIGRAIYDSITNNNILINYQKRIDSLKENNLLDEASRYSQVANKIVEVLDSLVKIYEKDKISYTKYKESFEYCIGEITVSNTPSYIDQVLVCDISKSRVDSKKTVYIIGLNEGKLPRNISEDVIFSDDELEKITKKGMSFRQNSKAKLYMQMYNITLALKSAKERLYLTYPASELNGSTLRPSNIITLTKKILPNIKIVGNVTKDDSDNILEHLYSEQTMVNSYIEIAGKLQKEENEISDKYKNVAFSYRNSNNDKVKKVLDYIRRDDNLSKESIEKIYGEELHTTVSRLEQYKKCAFSYFIKYGIKARERKIYKLSSMDIGSFIHEVIEKFSRYLQDNNKIWQEVIIADEYISIADSVISEILKEKAYLFNNNSKNILLKEKLLKSVKKVIKIIAESFNQSKFVPLGYEIEFKNGGMYAPIEIKLSENKSMYITGKIDRVDVLKLNNEIYARVVDYKSSDKTLEIDDIREGISLQLITYMSAIINNKEKIEEGKEILPAGMLYFSLLNDVKHLKEFEKDNSKIENKIKEAFRLKGIYIKDAEILEVMDNNIANNAKLIDANLGMKGKKYLEKDEFKYECSNISNILADIGKEVLKGRVKIYPNSKCKTKPCEYCEYEGICRKYIMK